ncbi:FAS-associated factor 1 [Aphelenchoides bicaudatus]|nr:FAS-associated factor 1 [Aphelenchoides bicaudatus]
MDDDNMETGSYNDLDDYSYSEDSQNATQLSTDRLPLVPTDFTSVQEALQNFSAVFESRYGLNPRFQMTSLRESLDEAFGNKYKTSVLEQKPLALYLHRDDAIGCNIFAQNVLCSEAVSSLLNGQFLVYPWDMTENENRAKFFEFLIENSLLQVKDVIKSVGKDDYPLLILLTKDRGTVSVDEIIRGTEIAETTMEKLINCLDNFQQIKSRIATEEQNRLEREAIRQEQVQEYEKSKAIDKSRQEEALRQKQREIDEQEEQMRLEEAKKNRQAELASMIPTEPSESDTETITIRVRFPTGEQKVRRFRLDESVSWLSSYVESLGFDMESHCLWTSDVPRKFVKAEDMTKTFKEIGWPRREQIIVDEKN